MYKDVCHRSFAIKLITPVVFADVLFTGTADGKIIKIEDGEIQTIARIGRGPCGESQLLNRVYPKTSGAGLVLIKQVFWLDCSCKCISSSVEICNRNINIFV